ncbi:MAG: YihY/virulence factor BrkB family protein [Bryobacteraceae bacterium]
MPTRRKRDSLHRAARTWGPTARYVMQTEIHVYAFSIAANVLLSFFPFLIVMVSVCRFVFGWEVAEQAIYLALRDYFPEQLGSFIQRNLQAVVNSRGAFQLVSILLLMFTANGIFEPLEVALNRAWRIPRNRSYLRNQILSLGLIFLCGGLTLISLLLTAVNHSMWRQLTGMSEGIAGRASLLFGILIFKTVAVPMTMLSLILIYWLLPNGKIPIRQVAPAAIVVGLCVEVLKYLNLLTWPWLRDRLAREYGPFSYSASILLWSFLGAMIVLAGAEWSARGAKLLERGASPDGREVQAASQAAETATEAGASKP